MDDIHTTEDKERSSISYNKKECDASFENDTLHIFIPIEYGNIEYIFVHEDIPSKNSNIWRINKVYANTKEERIEVTTNGEWECAIRLEGRSDFSGGKMHGNEQLTGVSFFADGEQIHNLQDFSEFDCFSVKQMSELYDPDDSYTVFAKRESEHKWTKEGLEISQKISWEKEENVISSYLAMFPASKKVFSEYKINDSEEQKQLKNSPYIRNVYSAKLIGDKITAIFSIKEFTASSNSFLVADNGSSAYWKCYYVAHEPKASIVEYGSVWKAKTLYKININKQTDNNTATNIQEIRVN